MVVAAAAAAAVTAASQEEQNSSSKSVDLHCPKKVVRGSSFFTLKKRKDY